MTDATAARPMTRNLIVLALLVGTVPPSSAAKNPQASIPRIASDYVNVYKPAASFQARVSRI